MGLKGHHVVQEDANGCRELPSQYWRACGKRWLGKPTCWRDRFSLHIALVSSPQQTFVSASPSLLLSNMLPPCHIPGSADTPSECCYTAVILLLILFLHIILRSSGNPGRLPT